MKEGPVHHYYARHLLKTQAQVVAADLLLGTLLLRKQLQGQNISYYANCWRVTAGRLHTNCERARGEVRRVMAGGHARDDLQSAGRTMRVSDMRANFRKYAPVLDQIEMDLCMELDDERTEALIRGMFKEGCNAVFVQRHEKRLPRAVTHPRRGPGRPPGSKNKPKADQNGEGWLMPDGTRKIF